MLDLFSGVPDEIPESQFLPFGHVFFRSGTSQVMRRQAVGLAEERDGSGR